MDIKKVFRQIDCNALVAFKDDYNCIRVDFFTHAFRVEINTSVMSYYAEDIENYEEVSEESFFRVLMLAKHRISQVTDNLNGK